MVDVEEVAHGPSGVVFAGVLLLYGALLGLGGVSLGRVSLVAGGNTLPSAEVMVVVRNTAGALS